jgi:hypothetical protein
VVRPEKTATIEIVFTPSIMIGQVLEVQGEPFIVTGIANRMAGFATTKLSVVEPNWWWKLKYKAKRTFRNAWRWITRPFRWAYRRARRG